MKDNKLCKHYLKKAEWWIERAEWSIKNGFDDMARDIDLPEVHENIVNAKYWIENRWYFIQTPSFY